jgi:hypothetical protein
VRALPALGALALAQTADVASTLYSLAAGNVETNPILSHGGPAAFVAAKLLSLALAAAILAAFPTRRRLPWAVAIGAAATLAAAAFNVVITL